MGKLIYGAASTAFEVDDRTLAHVEMVTLAKLRRNENFALTIESTTSGRTTLWLASQTDLQFVFDGPKQEINRVWLDQLVDSANTATGLQLLPE